MLEARDLTFSHATGKTIYQGFNLQVAPGERVALSAPSGFGKTTLCQMLAGYLKPCGGDVLVDGKPLPRRGRMPVQMIWQHPEVAVDPCMRMAETLAEAGLGNGCMTSVDDPSITQAQRDLLERLGIRDTWLPRYPHELSGGELQRFCIARALAAEPRYLIADEVSTMLDAVTQARIWHVLLEECEAHNLGMVLVSHSPALTKRVATRTVVLA